MAGEGAARDSSLLEWTGKYQQWSMLNLGRQPTRDVAATELSVSVVLVGIKTCRSQEMLSEDLAKLYEHSLKI